MTAGKFSTIESKLVKNPIIGYDTEDNSKGTVTEHAFYSADGPFHTYSYEEALDYIYSQKEQTIFVCHNLEYDIANLFRHDDYVMIDDMTYSGQLLKVTLAGTTHYFINSSSFYQGKLESMAKIVGLEKLDITHGAEYVTRDAEIVYRFMMKFQDKVVDDLGVNLGITVGQMTMETYRRNYMLSKTQKTWNSKTCLKAYYGGRVEIFYKGVVENVIVSDINSCYPDVMKNELYPDTSNISPSTLATHEYGVGKFKVEVPESIHIPPLPYRSPDGKLFFPAGVFTGFWTYHEVRYAISLGVKIIREWPGEGTNSCCMPFLSFIDTHYNLRLNAKEILKRNEFNYDAKFDDFFYKYWCNNLYGKFSQHKAGRTLTREKWTDQKFDKHTQKYGEEFKTSKIGPFYSYEVPKTEPPKTANFMWGTYVTSYARIKLHKGIMATHNKGYTVLYCDTDSVMYSRPANSPSAFKLSNNLGDWDEEKFGLGVFAQAKGYLLCDKKGPDYEIQKVACKGVNTHFAYDFIIEGMATFQKPMRMKEALIRTNAAANKDKDLFLEEIGENIWSDVEKKMQSIYIKRRGESGITYPVLAEDIPELEKNVKIKSDFSIQAELEKYKINIIKPLYENKFENTELPDQLGIRNLARDYTKQFDMPKQIKYSRQTEMEGYKKGDIWLSGHVIANRETKTNFKEYYILYLEVYKTEETPPNFFRGLWGSFLEAYGIPEKIIGKKLVISLSNNYLSNSKPEFDIKISSSELLLPVEEETDSSELKTLEAMDWSTIKWTT